jgi:cytochrome P450
MLRVNLISATETRWKNMRNIMNPAFSSLKLRRMNPILKEMTQRLLENIEKHSSENTLDIRK